MHYLLTHLHAGWALTLIHVRLALIPVLLGLLIAVPLGAFTWPRPALRRLTTVSASIIFTIPSLALFVILPLIIPTRILDEANVIVALTLYTTALLVRAVPEALDAVPGHVRDAAAGHRLHAARAISQSGTAAVDTGSGRRDSSGRRHQYLDGGRRFGYRNRRSRGLVHRGVPGRQERSDRRRDHRDLRAGGRARHRHPADRPNAHPVGQSALPENRVAG